MNPPGTIVDVPGRFVDAILAEPDETGAMTITVVGDEVFDFLPGATGGALPKGRPALRHPLLAPASLGAGLPPTQIVGTVAQAALDFDLSTLRGSQVLAEELPGTLRALAPDVDGDGLDDVVVEVNNMADQLVLTNVGGARVATMPYGPWDTAPIAFPLPDLTGDGLGDVLVSVPDALGSKQTGFLIEDCRLELFPGTVNGYANVPDRTFPCPRMVHDLVPAQLDADPALEFVALDDIYDLFYDVTYAPAVVVFDDVDAGLGVLHEHTIPTVGSSHRLSLAPLGDVDGDGLDDILLVPDDELGATGLGVDLAALGSTADFAPSAPIATFDVPVAPRSVVLHTQDINADGAVDILAVASASTGHTALVWETPFDLQPQADTGDTSDTGYRRPPRHRHALASHGRHGHPARHGPRLLHPSHRSGHDGHRSRAVHHDPFRGQAYRGGRRLRLSEHPRDRACRWATARPVGEDQSPGSTPVSSMDHSHSFCCKARSWLVALDWTTFAAPRSWKNHGPK